MEAIAETLGNKLREWKPETSDKVRLLVAEIIELADADALDLVRSRDIEQEVLNLLDESPSRSGSQTSVWRQKHARLLSYPGTTTILRGYL